MSGGRGDDPGAGMAGFRVARIDELDRIALDHGIWRPLRRRLGVTAFGINAYSAEGAGSPLIERHDETGAGAGGHQEVYLVVGGRAMFTVAGEPIDAPAGTLLAIDPEVMREAVSAEGETTVLVIGGEPGAAMPPSPFEYWYSAIPAREAGDHARAAEIVAEGLEDHPDHGAIHYALACELAMDGRAAEALEHLELAFADDPRTREWAATDSDFDSLRADPRYPGGPAG
ncbi:MAG: hypothetical protein GEU88_02215 [Solirubrobacterales bacterium]|nr:hypothetical protein [Solirubrobacterales bacterium]